MSNRRRASSRPRRRPARPRAPKSTGDRGATLVERLDRLPRLVVPLVTFALFVYGALGRPLWLALGCLIVLIAFLIWLASISWSRTNTRGRLVREIMIMLIILTAVSRLAGWS